MKLKKYLQEGLVREEIVIRSSDMVYFKLYLSIIHFKNKYINIEYNI